MDVMGGCCGQTFLAVSPDGRKKLFRGPEALGEVLGTFGGLLRRHAVYWLNTSFFSQFVRKP